MVQIGFGLHPMNSVSTNFYLFFIRIKVEEFE
jgi:hypothetical protein